MISRQNDTHALNGYCHGATARFSLYSNLRRIPSSGKFNLSDKIAPVAQRPSYFANYAVLDDALLQLNGGVV